MRRGLLPIVGRRIARIEYPRIPYRPIGIFPSRAKLAARVQGQRVDAIDRIGKRVLVRLGSCQSIVLQPKMAGLVLLGNPPSDQHVRVVFHLSGRQKLDRFLYWDRRGLGTVCLWTESEVQLHLGPNALGPDASQVDAVTFIARLRASRKEVKVALLDQRLVCGIGNIYAAEILFAAGVHPHSRCDDLSETIWKKIHHQMIRILREAIEKKGSTLGDGTYRTAVSHEGAYQNEHQVYDRENQPCLRCRQRKIQRIVQAQRSTFYCPYCQPRGGRRSRRRPPP